MNCIKNQNYIKLDKINFKILMESKKEIGGNIHRDFEKKSESNNAKVLGRKRTIEHLKKYPEINIEQYLEYEKEFAPLKSLRPIWK